MATVPTVDGPSVTPTAAPNAYQDTPRALGAAGAAVSQQFGMAQQAANGFADRYRQEQELADQVRVDDAINKAKERQIDLTFNKDTGFTNVKGINALQRSSGKPLADDYANEYKTSLDEITGTLGNDRQKRAFQMRANDMLTGFKSQVMAHEGQEFHDYTVSVREGTIANRKQEIGLYYNDPNRIDAALASINAAVTDMGRNLGGKSAEWIEARSRKEQSDALVGAVGAALERNDLMYADGLIKKYSDRMDANDLLRVRGATDKQMDAAVATKVATDAVKAVAPKVQPTDYDRIVNITMNTESGGKRYGADGKLLTSSAGAKGEMQVMDGTNLDPGFGVKPADMSGTPEQQAAERARVGRDYLSAMIKKYDGNVAQAWAAYNAGPGAVDKAMADAAKDGPELARRSEVPTANGWLKKLPAETQAYVAKNVAAYQQGEGRPQVPTLEDVHNNVRTQLAGTMNPSRIKLAIDESTRQWEDMQKSIKQKDEAATSAAQQWLANNGGRFSLLPNSIRQAVPPKELDNLIAYSQKIAKGEDRTEPDWYQKLSDQNYLRGLSDNEFSILSQRYLSEQDRKHFASERGRLLTGTQSDKPSDLNTGAVKSVLDMRLRELQIDPSPKDDGGSDAARIGAIRQYVDRSLLAAQQAAGKKFTDGDIAKHIDGLFAQTDRSTSWFGLTSSSKPLVSMTASDIPSVVRSKLKDDFKANGIDSPTDAQLLGAYLHARSRTKK